MNDFVQLVLELLQQGLGLAVAAIGLCLVALLIGYFIYRAKTKGKKKFPWRKAILSLLFIGYIVVLIYATLLRLGGTGFRGTNLHLFRAWREAWNNYSLKNWLNVLLNIAMFIPLGFLLPCIKDWFCKWYLMFITGFGTSLLIEIIQYITIRGLFDVDDLFTNTVGAMLGYCTLMVVTYLFRKGSRKKSIFYAVYPIVCMVCLVVIFAKYELQEYGNLPVAPTMTANLKGTEWKLLCELADDENIVPTYSVAPYNKEQCEAFSVEFAQMMNVSFPDAYYYDNSIIFANHSTGDFLYVYYFDRSYEYSVGNVEYSLEYVEVDEETMRRLIQPYNIAIPETAVFSYEGNGIHEFTVKLEKVGDSLIDGTIRCRVKEGPVLDKLDNKLATYCAYSEIEIISEAKAYDQMIRGEFYGCDTYEYYRPETVMVYACQLEYRVDTKGFYLPVYVFDVLINGKDNGEIVIPAMN